MKMFLVKYRIICCILGYLFFQEMPVSIVSGALCEYDDANLIWRDSSAYAVSDVKAMAWYNGKHSLIATWEETKGFKEYPPYIGRLMQIGETGIKLKSANRSDSGSYWLSLTLASKDNKLETKIHLEVLEAPSIQCKPIITEEGSVLRAKLPPDGCGTPPLTLKWKHNQMNVTIESDTSSLLDLGTHFESGEYVVCAEGYAITCYNGNISDLCTGITKLKQERRDDGSKPELVSILPIVLVVVLIATITFILVLIIRKLNYFRGNREREQMNLGIQCTHTKNDETGTSIENKPLIEGDTALREDFPQIRNYLRSLYKDMTSISMSPTGNLNFVDVSEVYIDLEFQQMKTSDLECKETGPTGTSSDEASVPKDECFVKVNKPNFSRIIIAGCRGCGKSTWCKHLLQCWTQDSKNADANMKAINLANLEEYQILLYLPLKSSDKGRSLQQLLKQTLFQEQTEYLNIIEKYMQDKTHSKSILVLIDGLDKINESINSVLKLIDHDLLSLCTVIFMCRPDSLKLNLNVSVDSSLQFKLFQVCEIPVEKSTEYASKVLSSLHQQKGDFNVDKFLTFTKNLHLQNLLKIPYLCLMVLLAWMENRNPYIEITDILLRIVEDLMDTSNTDQRCKENVMKLSQGSSTEEQTEVRKFGDRFINIKNIIYELSIATEEIFLCKTKVWTDEERKTRENHVRNKYKLHIEVLNEMGIVTVPPVMTLNQSLLTLTYTNDLIYHLFLSIAMTVKEGQVYNYIISDLEVALKHSIVIHMLWQLSPNQGKEICVNIRKLGSKHSEKSNVSKQCDKFNCSITKATKTNKYKPVKWLEMLMYNGELHDEKLLFLTNIVRSMDSLTSLTLENTENKNDLVFWLPCSKTLRKLKLNISHCTLLLCPEWNNHTPLELKEVVIEFVKISRFDLALICKALKCCTNIKKQKMSPTVVDNVTLRSS